MKTFNNLFYVGIILITTPLIFCLLMLMTSSDNHNKEIYKEKIIYDTVEVKQVIKVYDTIRPKKKKSVEKINTIEIIDKVVTDTLNSN